MAYPDHLFLRYFCLDQCIKNAADAGRVNADFIQFAGGFDVRDDGGYLGNIVTDRVNQRQVAIAGEVAESLSLRLPAFEH